MISKLRTIALSPYAWIAVLGIGGATCVVAGVAVLAGLGWTLITAGAFGIGAASYITKGLVNV